MNKKFTSEEAWQYVIDNEKLIWSRIWGNGVPKDFHDDVMSEARIELVHRLLKNGLENFYSLVDSSVIDGWKKCYKTNASDFNRLKKRGVIAC
ncbi:hypothetical protein [Cytobacillus sp. NCCP-133]|uniref:hypothetical protein n=1 Tax=Cytobacillus sp. NCCP-133 TaxID=766848 RepID=UPI00222E12F7|nr:hypothetical protein [Cytobacillus sp. NCCP-133]GLB58663.1 hypothetical protein NCCP133_07960 [Cytobacillus sp. NCCP-133]